MKCSNILWFEYETKQEIFAWDWLDSEKIAGHNERY